MEYIFLEEGKSICACIITFSSNEMLLKDL